MKFLFLLATILSFVGVFGIDQFNQSPSFSLWDYKRFIIIPIILISIGIIIYKWYQNSKSLKFIININIKKLDELINDNEADIEKIRKKITATSGKLIAAGKISNNIKEVTDSNIALWKDQIEIHRKIIHICRTRIASLGQSQNELDLLKHLIKEINGEPKTEKKLAKLEKLVNEIETKVKLKFSAEISKLILELKTDTRREKIIQLNDRIKELVSKAS